jgi:hypothetical protein
MKLLREFMRINADGEDFSRLFVLFRQKAFQLPELFGAVGSPMAAIEDQDDILAPAEIRERDSFARHVFESEVGSLLADLDSFEIRRPQVCPVFRTQLRLAPRRQKERNRDSG